MLSRRRKIEFSKDRIEGDKIFLDINGQFPKRIIIEDHNSKRAQNYKIVKTRNDKFQLIK